MPARPVGFPSVIGRPNDGIKAFIRDRPAAHGVGAQVLPRPEGDRADLGATIGPSQRPVHVPSGHRDMVPAAAPGCTRPAG